MQHALVPVQQPSSKLQDSSGSGGNMLPGSPPAADANCGAGSCERSIWGYHRGFEWLVGQEQRSALRRDSWGN